MRVIRECMGGGTTTHRSNCRHQLQSSMRNEKIRKDIVEIMEHNFMIIRISSIKLCF